MGMAFDTLAYARRLREAGFTEQQAEGQAEALAAAMTDTLATRHDLEVLATRQDVHDLAARTDLRFERIEARFTQVDTRFENIEQRMNDRFTEVDSRMDLRFQEQSARFETVLADLERRMTMRLGGIVVAAFGMFSALVKVL